MRPEAHAPVVDAFLAVDVGTRSARAALFSAAGARLSATHVRPIRTRNATRDHFEQSSANIWRAVCCAVRDTCADAGATVTVGEGGGGGGGAGGDQQQQRCKVAAIGFDATCSLVAAAVSEHGSSTPVSVVTDASPNHHVSLTAKSRDDQHNQNIDDDDDSDNNEGDDVFDVVLWLDHRAVKETSLINSSNSGAVRAVLRHFGDKISPENEPGKLAHLKNHMAPSAWHAATFFDLADWLAFKCLGSDIARSSCTTACKWGWGSGDSTGWSRDFWTDVGLGDLTEHGFRRLGRTILPPGHRLGTICPEQAAQLNLSPTVAVASPMIDAHCGALAMLGPAPCELLDQHAPDIHDRLAMICGTSTCHIAVGPKGKPIFVPGVWGPFPDAVVVGRYCTEGGQSATGVLVDHIVDSHRAAPALRRRAAQQQTSLYALLAEMTGGTRQIADLADPACDVHVFPDFHGNRSPRADPSLRGGVVGLTLATSQEQAEQELAILFRSCIQALAYGTRHIIEEMNRAGHTLKAVVACGGLCKSDLFMRELADACRMPVFCLTEPDSVLLGGAILAAAAASSGDDRLLEALVNRMSRIDQNRVFVPLETRRHFHDRKYRVFLTLYEDQMKYKAIMRS